jgi:hypothetical protein
MPAKSPAALSGCGMARRAAAAGGSWTVIEIQAQLAAGPRHRPARPARSDRNFAARLRDRRPTSGSSAGPSTSNPTNRSRARATRPRRSLPMSRSSACALRDRCEARGAKRMKFDTKDLKRLQWAIAFLLIMSPGRRRRRVDHATDEKKQRPGGPGSHGGAQGHTEQAFRGPARRNRSCATSCRFQALKERGYIGPEKRLDWIETIARIKTARRIFKLDYEFAPQRPLDAAYSRGRSGRRLRTHGQPDAAADPVAA